MLGIVLTHHARFYSMCRASASLQHRTIGDNPKPQSPEPPNGDSGCYALFRFLRLWVSVPFFPLVWQHFSPEQRGYRVEPHNREKRRE